MLDIPVISTVYLLLDLLKSFFFFFASIVVFNIQILYTYVLKDLHLTLGSAQFSSVTQSCLTLCDPINHSTPGLPVYHQLPEFTQTHVH